LAAKKARAASPGFCFLAPRGWVDEASRQPDVVPAERCDDADVVISRPFPGLAKAGRCT
jgi:hypothetical protein